MLDSSGYMKLTDFGLSKLGIRHVMIHSQEINRAHEATSEAIQADASPTSPALKRMNSYQKKTLLGYNANTKKRIIGTPDYIAP